jgi:hypothetical protein
MFRHKLALAASVMLAFASAPSAQAEPAVTVLVNSAHGANQLVADFEILEPDVIVGTQVVIDRTVCDPSSTTFDPTFVADSQNSALSFYSVLTGSCGPPITGEENYAPYALLNQSFSDPPSEPLNYTALEAYDQSLSLPFLGACDSGYGGCPQPPIYSTNVFSPDSGNPAAGDEFEMSAGYLGFETSAPSWTTAAMSAVLAALRYEHPTWAAPDVVAALRQTASNWSSGYDAATGGYGTIDFSSADGISSTSELYLQPPLMIVANERYYATIKLYPFRQTRRAHEVIYSVNPSYQWPVKNEYTTSDIVASGATLLYTSNGTDITPVYTYEPSVSGTLTVIAFTTDGDGNYSRVESFSSQQAALIVGTACLQP